LFPDPSSPILDLKSSKRYSTDNALVRIKPVADTLAEIIPLSKKIGVTRLSDITCLDRLYIPNFSAILPGTEDSIWVYSGKGTTKAQAKAGALMEAIERNSSLSTSYSKDFVQGTYRQLSKSYNKVLHPAEVVEPVNQLYSTKNSITDFLPGFDLLNNEHVLVPAQLALSSYTPESPSICAFPYSHTNGLASGNVLEEAICHALCEVIERDTVSIADLCSSFIPYSILEMIRNSFEDMNVKYSITPIPQDKFVDTPCIFPDVDISEIVKEFEPVRYLVKRFVDAGIPLLIKNITSKDIGIPTFVASSIEWISPDYGYFAKGFGTHPDARVALVRAITEVSQTRAVNIQGARDDLKKIEYKQNDEIYKRKWQFIPATKDRNKTIRFSEIRTSINKDILDDIKIILNGLRNAGLKRAIIIDLTKPNLRIPVVRAIVPGLETFEVAKLFMGTELFMGGRAKKTFKEFCVLN
jgi:ribosomal protein S12 methylthiotransferase accessory factor YcaO